MLGKLANYVRPRGQLRRFRQRPTASRATTSTSVGTSSSPRTKRVSSGSAALLRSSSSPGTDSKTACNYSPFFPFFLFLLVFFVLKRTILLSILCQDFSVFSSKSVNFWFRKLKSGEKIGYKVKFWLFDVKIDQNSTFLMKMCQFLGER